jgi:hypothetical protein
MYPNWILLIFVLIGLLGITIGLLVFLEKKKIKTGYFQLFGLIVIGIITDFIIVAY